jgi:hypothetical protein
LAGPRFHDRLELRDALGELALGQQEPALELHQRDGLRAGDELDLLDLGLHAVEHLLAPGGVALALEAREAERAELEAHPRLQFLAPQRLGAGGAGHAERLSSSSMTCGRRAGSPRKQSRVRHPHGRVFPRVLTSSSMASRASSNRPRRGASRGEQVNVGVVLVVGLDVPARRSTAAVTSPVKPAGRLAGRLGRRGGGGGGSRVWHRRGSRLGDGAPGAWPPRGAADGGVERGERRVQLRAAPLLTGFSSCPRSIAADGRLDRVDLLAGLINVRRALRDLGGEVDVALRRPERRLGVGRVALANSRSALMLFSMSAAFVGTLAYAWRIVAMLRRAVASASVG